MVSDCVWMRVVMDCTGTADWCSVLYIPVTNMSVNVVGDDVYISGNDSLRSLASKGFPSGYLKRVCVCLHSENSETYDADFSNDA